MVCVCTTGRKECLRSEVASCDSREQGPGGQICVYVFIHLHTSGAGQSWGHSDKRHSHCSKGADIFHKIRLGLEKVFFSFVRKIWCKTLTKRIASLEARWHETVLAMKDETGDCMPSPAYQSWNLDKTKNGTRDESREAGKQTKCPIGHSSNSSQNSFSNENHDGKRETIKGKEMWKLKEQGCCSSQYRDTKHQQ